MRFPPPSAVCNCPSTAWPFLGRLVLGMLILAAATAPLPAQPPTKNLPAELAAVPQDAFAFLYFRPAELWQSELAANYRKLFPREAGQLLAALGEDPEETESFIVVYPTAEVLGAPFTDFLDDNRQAAPAHMLFIETTVKPFEQTKVLERVLGKGAVPHKHLNRIYYTPKNTGGFLPGTVHFINNKTYLFAFTDEMMKKALAGLDRPRSAGPLTAAFDLAGQKRQVVLGLNATRPGMDNVRKQLTDEWVRFGGGPVPIWALAPLLQVRSAAVGIELGKEIRLDAEMTFPDARQATKASAAAQDALTILRLFGSRIFSSDNRFQRFDIERAEEEMREFKIREEDLKLLKIRDEKGEMAPLVPGAANGREDIPPQILVSLLQKQLKAVLSKAVVEQSQATLKIRSRAPIDMQALSETPGNEDFAFIHVRVAEIWRSELGAKLRKLFPELEQAPPFTALAAMGLTPDGVDNVVMVLPNTRNLGMMPPPRTRSFKEEKKTSGFEPKQFDKDKREDKKDEKKEEPKAEPKESGKVGDNFELLLSDGRLETVSFQPFGRDDDFLSDGAVVIVVTTVKPYDRAKILKTAFGKARERKHLGKTYFTADVRFNTGAVHFIDDHKFLAVSEAAWMPRVLDRATLFQVRGPLAAAVASAAKKNHLVVGLNLNEPSVLRAKWELARELQRAEENDLFPLSTLEPLLQVRSILLTADLGKDVRVQAEATFPSAEQAAGSLKAVEDVLSLGRLYTLALARAKIRSAIQDMIEDTTDVGPLVYGETVLIPGERPVLIPQRDLRPLFFTDGLMAQAETILRKATVEKDGAKLSVLAQGRFDVSALETEAREAALTLVKSQETAHQVRKSAKNLTKLIDAMQGYHDVHGKLPASGRLSWRVHILPFMDELALYQEFKQDEPWDSPHNIKLLPRMPKVFAAPGIKTKEAFTTYYQTITGPGTIFDPNIKGKGIPAGIGIVEAFEPVPWTKPADVVYDAKKPLPKLGGIFPHGFHVAFIDGRVSFITGPAIESLRGMLVIPRDRFGFAPKFDK